MARIKVVTTDYIEGDLDWEREQYAALGVAFAAYQLKLGTREQLLAVAAEADVIIVNMARFSAPVIEGLQHTRLIIRHGIGYDNVDVAAATRCGIAVGNVPDYCVNEVAEQAVMLMLSCQRKLLLQNKLLSASAGAGAWDFQSINSVFSIHGKTVGIVGFGRIGSTVFRMLQGFAVRFLVCDPYLSPERQQQFGITAVPLAQVLGEADIITIHTPLTAETHHMFDEPQFRMMKRTAVLVNTARGGIINLPALDAALRAGLLAHAGIDVYEEREPPHPDDPLLNNPAAICTPHLAWLSEEANWSIRTKIVADVRRFMNGEGPRYQVNPEVRLFGA